MIVTSCLFISAVFGVNAQIKSGIIKYEMVTNLAGAAQTSGKDIPEAILAMIPKEIKKTKQLRFSETTSIYENLPVDKKANKEEDEPQESGGMSFQIKRMGTGDGDKEKIFIDHIKNQKVEAKDFFGKEFLVTKDSINKIVWKPTGKQKLLLNYPCYEATTMGEVRGKQEPIKAWYTTAIATKAGPMGYCNLPGMILQIEMGDNLTITATEVKEKAFKSTEIEKPTNGKKVTAAEFKEIENKKMKEMGIERGKPRVMFHTSTEMQ